MNSGRSRIVPCTVTLADGPDGLYAHVDLVGHQLNPGDTVRLLGPQPVCTGEARTIHGRALVEPARGPRQAWARVTSRLRVAELFEIAFSLGSTR